MNKGQMLVLEMGLNKVIELIKNSKNIGLKYKMAMNKEILNQECSIIKKLDNTTENYNSFQRERMKINEDFSIKDDKGKAIIENKHFKIDPNLVKEYTDKMNELETKYRSDIEFRNEQIQKYNLFLNEDVENSIVEKLKKIKLSDLEKESSLENESIDLFSSLLPIIEE